MESGTLKVAKMKCEKIRKDEARQFSVAYSELKEEYHGFLQELPQKVSILNKEVSPEGLKELRDLYGYENVYAYKGKTFFVKLLPYLGIDGCIAQFQDTYKENITNIDTSLISVEGKLVAKAVVNIDRSTRTGLAEIPKDETGTFESVDLYAVAAVRKALSLFGIGRFGTDQTQYGGSLPVEQFLTFIKNQKQAKNEN